MPCHMSCVLAVACLSTTTMPDAGTSYMNDDFRIPECSHAFSLLWGSESEMKPRYLNPNICQQQQQKQQCLTCKRKFNYVKQIVYLDAFD